MEYPKGWEGGGCQSGRLPCSLSGVQCDGFGMTSGWSTSVLGREGGGGGGSFVGGRRKPVPLLTVAAGSAPGSVAVHDMSSTAHCAGQWAVQLLQRTATPPGGGGQWNSLNAQAPSWGGRGVLPRRRSLPKEQKSCNALPHCLGAVGSGTHVMHCHTAWGHGQWNSCNAPPHYLGAWAVELLQCTTTLPRGSEHWNSCNTLPHCLGVVGSATLAIHCHTVSGRWVVELLQCAGQQPRGTGNPAKEAVAA